jgi:hypothetical protein
MLPGMKQRIEPAHAVPYRPDHGSADAVWLGDDGFVGHIDPFAVDADAVVAVAAFPIGIADHASVGIRAARPLAAFQGVEPRPQVRVGVAELAAVAGAAELRCEPRSTTASATISGVLQRQPRPCRLSGPRFS